VPECLGAWVPEYLSDGNGRSRKAAKDAKQGSFFFAKKKAVLAFLCVLAPLREPPFHFALGIVPARKSL
jgi:hypothetical protein